MIRLTDIGWTDERDRQFERYLADGFVPARVSLEHNHIYRVLSTDGEILAEVAGRLRHEAAGQHALPVVGDWVAVRLGRANDRGVISLILPRKGAFSRQSAGRESGEQVIAANIDTVFLVSGLDSEFNLRRIERYIVLARQSGALPVVILNKADLVADASAAVAAVSAIAPDFGVHAISSKDGRGFDAVEQYVKLGSTVALLGSSGVGKSSIVNRLVGHDVMKTAEVRASDSRGRHTSVHRQLIVLDRGGLLIDTPGMRELQLWDGSEAVAESFVDIETIGAACRFRDCRHDKEPGCAVKTAAEAGELDRARYDSYIKLMHERDAFQRRNDDRALLESKRQSKATGKALKAAYRDKDRGH